MMEKEGHTPAKTHPGKELTGASDLSKVRSAIVRAEVFMEGLFQPMHLLVIFFIALLFFGPKKLPELGKGIGEGFRALKEGMKDASAEPKASEPISNRKADTEVKS